MAACSGAAMAPDEEHGAEGKHLERMCTLFLASICQTKEHIEHLEAVFSQNLYPAWQQSIIQRHEAETADLRRDWEEAERRWQREREILVAERDDLAREKEALVAERDAAVAKLEQENRDLDAKVRSLKRKRDELLEDQETKRVAFRSMNSRYSSLKMKYDSMLRQQAVASGIESLRSKEKEMTGHQKEFSGGHNKELLLSGIGGSKENEAVASGPGRVSDARKEKEGLVVEAKTEARIEVFGYKKDATPIADRRKQKGTLKDFFTTSSSKDKWRSTRAENDGGRDPHDDFLNTPQEIAMKKIAAEKSKPRAEETVHFVPDTLGIEWENHIEQPGGAEDHSDAVETLKSPGRDWTSRGANAAKSPGKEWIAPGKSGAQLPKYKFNEPVRKKADREALKGVECKQCKKFYDAVELPGDGNGNSRCEHHNQVSRHRYKHVPPSTPEGFWNIGFSET